MPRPWPGPGRGDKSSPRPAPLRTLCTVRLGLSAGSRKYIEIPILLDPGSCHRARIEHCTAHQLIRMGIPEEQFPPWHLTISGYDGGSRQHISSQITPILSLPGTRFHDPSTPMSIVELPNRPYKAIIGWPYIQDNHIAIDGDGPLARFPQTRIWQRHLPRANPRRNKFPHSVFVAC